MSPNLEVLEVLRCHGVPFVVIGGHAVNIHGFHRTTEDVDIVWLRSEQSKTALLKALAELNAEYIGNDIDPATGIERAHPVTLTFIQTSHLMMLCTKLGFLDLFDYIPGFPDEDPMQLFTSAIAVGDFKFASLDWLRKMKRASGRDKDLIDLKNLPEA